MTSGRCAATEAVEPQDAAVERRVQEVVKECADSIALGRDGIRDLARAYVREETRAALASPCCVPANSQEQVKEALEKLRAWAAAEEERARPIPIGMAGWLRAQTVRLFAEDALALLGSNEEEEQDA